ncbi:hypothetical protein [Phenylobacterium sp.]|uniref:hypothetical protein n=1 Tax=Phenylobacterium sp. TaxID=1871053 RepID=UPI0025D3163D|nr:hypothetical protein [Phenylobacterium sp.]MBX3482602.1 hypothetical protein [Phenylobacterium sp.]MCW5759662.1 hypothetical protein [Phenylobacterium sp.]
MKLLVLALAALAAVAIAAATEDADAQTLSPEAAALIAATRAAPARAQQTHAAFAPRYDGEKPVRLRGVAQTSVDAPLGDDATGSLGFMCGLKPGAEKYGVAAARGYDETGRFIGAKLRVAFK